MSQHDRDLALAIHHEIISPESVDRALDYWHEMLRQPERIERTARDLLWTLLATTSGAAIDAVLARRQRASRSGATEAARTGPWEGGHHGEPIKDVGPGFAAFLRREIWCEAGGCRWQWFAERQSEDGEDRDHYVWCRGCGSAYPWRDTYYLRRLFEAGEQAATGPQEEPGYPGSLLPPKRGAP